MKIKERLIRNIPVNILLKIKFPLEHKILKKRKIEVSNRQSILFFTTQKAASSAIYRLFNHINSKCLGMRIVDYSNYFYLMSEKSEYESLNNYKGTIFLKRGVIYSPLRDYVHIEQINEYNVIFFLRDPRDVLVSNYYSLKFSHGLPINKKRLKQFKVVRKKLEGLDINEFVREQSDFFLKKYTDYLNHMSELDNYTLLKYEDMIIDYNNWIDNLLESLNIESNTELKNEIVDILDLRKKPTNENVNLHLRKKNPGDYKLKLDFDTQEFLNSKFKNVLMKLNYDL